MRRLGPILMSAAAIGFASRADSQSGTPPRVRLTGTVTRSANLPVMASVELFRAATVIRSTRANQDGHFEIDGLLPGEYRLVVRAIGFLADERTLTLSGLVDSVRVLLRDNKTVLDSIRRVEYDRKLAVARARPRRWDCTASDDEVRRAAVAAAALFVDHDNTSMRGLRREHGIPAARENFMRDFRAVTDAGECRRLAEALDRQIGLVDDRIRAFRVGSVYLLPEWGDGGMLVALDGRIISIFVVQG